MKLRSWHIDWLILLPLFAGLTMTRLSPRVLPIHDSTQLFQVFHFVYSNWLFTGEIAQWLPYCSYGMPIDFWINFCFTPASYLALGVGKLFGVTDVLLLFKLSIALEELVFLVGLYAFARLTLESRAAVLLVCIGGMLGLYWLFFLWWNFRIFYLVPAALAFVVLFFQRQQPHYLWLSGCTFVVSLLGNLPYYAPLYLFTVALFAGLMTMAMPAAWRSLLTLSLKNLGTLMAFVIFAVLYVYSVHYSLAPLTSATGRESGSLVTNMGDYLTHAGNPDVLDLVRQALLGWPIIYESHLHYPEMTIYIGLLPWFLLAWAIRYVRSPVFVALAGTTFMLLWLAAGGLLAATVYYLPSMSWFRHLSGVYPLCKIMVLICAGFGFQDFTRRARPGHLLLLAALALFLADCLLHIRFMLITKGLIQDTTAVAEWQAKGETLLEAHTLFAMRILLYVAAVIAVVLAAGRTQTPEGEVFRSPLFPVAFLLVYTFDMGSFMFQSQFAIDKVPDALTDTLETTWAAPLEFPERRSDQPESERADKAARLMAFMRDEALPGRASGMNYLTYAFTHQDTCTLESEFKRQFYFSPFHLKVVDLLLDAPVAKPDGYLAACEQPRLRLLRPVGVHADRTQYLEMINAGAEVAMINDNSELWVDQPQGSAIRVKHFSANRLLIEVDHAEDIPVWLVYSDADHPHWQARVNGAAVPIERAFFAFKAIELPAGHSVVQFDFRPGFFLSPAYSVGLIGIVAWLTMIYGLLAHLPSCEVVNHDPV